MRRCDRCEIRRLIREGKVKEAAANEALYVGSVRPDAVATTPTMVWLCLDCRRSFAPWLRGEG